MEGKNYVELIGFIRRPEVKETPNSVLFKGAIAIPFVYRDAQTGEEKQGQNYVNVCAWGDKAVALGELADGTPVHVKGVYNSRSYDGNCKSCGTPEKKYWTDIKIDDFIVVEGE